MRWQYKCLIDNCKGLLPCQDQLREIKYRFTSYKPDPPAVSKWTIMQGLLQVEWVRAARPLASAVILEIGCGWQPLIPVLFSLAGAECVILADSNRLCSPTSFNTALASLRSERTLILDSLAVGEHIFDEALSWDPSLGLDEGFRRLRLKYVAPCDCRRLHMPDASIDVVTSRAVLEHIAPRVIADIFTESIRLLKPSGLACHLIDNSDHWEHRDKRISRVNFLKYSDASFRWTCLNPQNYQNRLRHPEYVDMLCRCGFQILRDEREIDDKALTALRTLRISQRFRRFAPTDLATISSHLLAQKPVC
jgi:SAM-dependent methyltransferase